MEANDLIPASAIALEGAPNFRDLGGLLTADGRRLRRGLLYRSEALNTLSERDLEAVRKLGVRLVCDLRSRGERRDWPNRWPSDCAHELLTAADTVHAAAADLRGVLKRAFNFTEQQARAFMAATYHGFPEAFAPVLRGLFTHLIEARGPVLVHCAAGKDRTGFVVAMVLFALGVARETVETDYMLSDRHFGAERIMALLAAKGRSGLAPATVDVFRVRSEYLHEVLTQVETAHGSIEAYLQQQCGLTPDRRSRLKEKMLEA